MGVEQFCGTYIENLVDWKKVRDVISGERAIRRGGVTYLPRPSGMDDSEWNCYLERAHFFNATGRTADGLHGAVFEKKPVISDNPPEALKNLLEDVDRSGRGIDQFASDCVWDALPTNWGGIFVDYPEADEKTDRGTAEKLGLRAYAAWYTAESVINWRYENRGNKKVLTFIVLHEPYEQKKASDEFSSEIKNRYRVLDFDEFGFYRVRVYDDAGTSGLSIPESTTTPKIGKEALDFIPFFPFPGNEPEKSMLLDLANENIGHYQKTADYENGLHLTGIPTPYAAGLSGPPVDSATGKELPIKLGGNSFLFIPDAAGKAAYLEFEGTGLAQLEKAIQNTEERMAILGARIISAEKKGVESADAARIHRAGENSVLAAFALNASEVLTNVIRLLARWEGIQGCEKITYKLNTEYDVEVMESQLFGALTSAHISNKIGRKVYFYNLKKNGRVPEDMDLDGFEEDIADSTADHGPDGDDLNAVGTNDQNGQAGAVNE